MTVIRRLRNPASALTHLAGVIFALAVAYPLLHQASRGQRLPVSVFLLGMTLLYTASTLYHSLNLSPRANLRLKRLDHLMIFLLIAGTYTPICLLVLPGNGGLPLLAVVWAASLTGMVVKYFFIGCPKWFSSALYLVLGWACLPLLMKLWNILPRSGFFALLAGGLFYTVGAVIYALRARLFDQKHPHFNAHAVFHLFVLAGSACHTYLVLFCILPNFPA